LHVSPSFYPAAQYGGPTTFLLRLVEELVRQGVSLDLLTTNADGTAELDVPMDRVVDVRGVPVRYYRLTTRTPADFSAGLTARVMSTAGDYDLIHTNGLFNFTTNVVAVAARRAGRPFVVSPCGSLSAGALARKTWKKRAYLRTTGTFGIGVQRAAAVHAMSHEEARGIHEVMPALSVFEVPGGVDIPTTLPDVQRTPRRVAFLGRLHEIKGFDVLVPALSRVTAVMPDAEALFAGYDSGGEWAAIERLARAQSPVPRLRFLGPVSGDEKLRFLAGASALALTSHTESFGMVVLEALACGTPVVATKSCPWPALAEKGAGFWVDRTPEAVAAALLQLLGDPEAAAKMGAAGRAMAESYSWRAVGRSMAEQYAAIVERSRRG
jgi:glycosyltransferase involved in cell wall biosynthesis